MKRTFRHWHLNDHVTRWPLANGTFIDRENVAALRRYRDHPYEIYLSGAGEGGIAKLLRTCRTLKEAKAIAQRQGRQAQAGEDDEDNRPDGQIAQVRSLQTARGVPG